MGWVAPLVPVAEGAVDCASVGSSTARWSHVANGLCRGVSSLRTLLWQSSCHGGMGSLFGGHFRRCSFYTEVSSLFCELCFICVFDGFFICPCVFLVCTHVFCHIFNHTLLPYCMLSCDFEVKQQR